MRLAASRHVDSTEAWRQYADHWRDDKTDTEGQQQQVCPAQSRLTQQITRFAAEQKQHEEGDCELVDCPWPQWLTVDLRRQFAGTGVAHRTRSATRITLCASASEREGYSSSDRALSSICFVPGNTASLTPCRGAATGRRVLTPCASQVAIAASSRPGGSFTT